VRVAPKEEGQVLELRLDAVARLEVRLKSRIERRELGDATPDVAQFRENRAVALVQRRVALDAKPLDALRAGEHLPERRELDVLRRLARFRRLERRAIELSQLKGDHVQARFAIAGRGSCADELLLHRAKGPEG